MTDEKANYYKPHPFKTLERVPSPSKKFYLYKKVSVNITVGFNEFGDMLPNNETVKIYKRCPENCFVVTHEHGTHVAALVGVSSWIKSIARDKTDTRVPSRYGKGNHPKIWEYAESLLADWIDNGYK